MWVAGRCLSPFIRITLRPRQSRDSIRMDSEPIVRVANVHKFFRRGSEQIDVLLDLSLDVPEGEFLALMGPSGSGKTTLLNLIAGLDRPSQGTIEVGNDTISQMSEASLAKWRTRNVGFVFQFYNLLPVLTAYENVELPLLLVPMSKSERRRQVTNALDLVGSSRTGCDTGRGSFPAASSNASASQAGHRDRPDVDRRRRTNRRSRFKIGA